MQKPLLHQTNCRPIPRKRYRSPPCKTQPRPPPVQRLEFKQKGVVLLLLLLIFLVGGTSMMIGTFDNRQDLYLRQQAELSNQLQLAKEALLAFAANSSAIYNNTRGPGFFPCPDTENTG